MVLDPSSEFFRYIRNRRRRQGAKRARASSAAGRRAPQEGTRCRIRCWAAFALVLVRRGAAAACSRRGCGATASASSSTLTDGQLRFIGLVVDRRRDSSASGSCAMRKLDPSRAHRGRPPGGSRADRGAAPRAARSLPRRTATASCSRRWSSISTRCSTGTGRDLELQTFKVVDPLSGRLLGVRADMTPQVARIDAHLLNEAGVTRLCYAGSVLRTVPTGVAQTREVMQIGAELFGEPGIAGDIEVTRAAALVARRRAAFAGCISISATSASIARSRAARGIAGNGERYRTLRRAAREGRAGASTELTAKLPAAWRDALAALPTLYGPARRGAGSRARARCPDTPAIRQRARGAAGAGAVARRPHVDALHIDLADLTRLPLPQRRDLLGVHGRRAERDRQRRPLRRHRQGVRARAPGDRLHAGPAPARGYSSRANTASTLTHGQERRRHRHPVGR